MAQSPVSAPLLFGCDDAATLEAALDFVDHCDALPTDSVDPDQTQDFNMMLDNFSEILGQVDIPEPEKSAADEIVVSEPSRRRRTTPKQEIAQLRAEERELACRLENLRLQSYGQKQRGVSGKNSTILPFWKKIASRQYQSRLDSERENRRLRSLVTMHIGRAKRLKLAWKRQMTAEGYKKESEVIPQLPHELITPDTPALMEKLTQEADEIYATLESFCAGTREQQENRIPFLEHSDSYSLPFQRQTVTRAIWHRIAMRLSEHQQRQITVTDDTVRCCALRSLQLADMNLSLRIRWVTRRFREADRTVVITRTFIQPLHMTIPVQVGFTETEVLIVTSRGASDVNASSQVDSHACVTGDGYGTGDGMRAWMKSPDAAGARKLWMGVFHMRKNATEDQVFEDSRAQ